MDSTTTFYISEQELAGVMSSATEAYRKICNIHREHVDCNIVYPGAVSGSKLLNIEICALALRNGHYEFAEEGDTPVYPSIPVKHDINFNDWTFVVKNNCQSSSDNPFYLFTINNPSLEIPVSKLDVDSGILTSVTELNHGRKLLIAQDQHVWDRSSGVSYYRSDAILVIDGHAQNKPIYPYNTPYTYLVARYVDLDNYLEHITLNNLKFCRKRCSLYVTNFISVNYSNDVLFDNIKVSFYPSAGTLLCDSEHDFCFNIKNCTNVRFTYVNITDTYSTTSTYGYGVQMCTIWNAVFDECLFDAPWGVMGCRCINKMHLNGGQVNRVDIHSYGADIICKGVTFKSDVCPNKWNRFSSLFGMLYFDNCTFDKFIPLAIDSANSIYSGFDVVLRDCTIVLPPQKSIVKMWSIAEPHTVYRPEMQNICLQNFFMINSTVSFGQSSNNTEVVIFDISNAVQTAFDYISMITIRMLDSQANQLTFRTSNQSLSFCHEVQKNATNCIIN